MVRERGAGWCVCVWGVGGGGGIAIGVKDAKATKIVSIMLFKTNKKIGLLHQALLHLALQSTPNIITPNVIN